VQEGQIFGEMLMLNLHHPPLRFYKVILMLDPNLFEDLAARLSAAVAASPAADIEKNARALLSSFFAKLDLVSREEFDVQTQVLLRTREKLKALEARLDALEQPAAK
jgi:BMFP domain-containing protein YqiC